MSYERDAECSANKCAMHFVVQVYVGTSLLACQDVQVARALELMRDGDCTLSLSLAQDMALEADHTERAPDAWLGGRGCPVNSR
jgi:hypothetical protein